VDSGGNIVIENDHGRAVVSPRAGAALRSLAVNIRDSKHELLRGGDDSPLDPSTLPHGTGSFIMAPWPNRMPGGVLVTPDGTHTLRTGSELHTIHGLVRNLPWNVVSHGAHSASFEVDLPKPWPFAGKVAYEVTLAENSFAQALTIVSADGEFPAGAGWHPWFKQSIGGDGVEIKLDAEEMWVLDSEMTPSGETVRPPLLGQLRNGVRLAPGTTDDCFRVAPGSKATLSWPELTLDIEFSETVSHVMVYTPPDGGALCVEPQTTCVNAFQLHARGVTNTGTRFVHPGSPLVATTTWSWH
jgi:galactose mutarotase-like enzyme